MQSVLCVCVLQPSTGHMQLTFTQCFLLRRFINNDTGMTSCFNWALDADIIDCGVSYRFAWTNAHNDRIWLEYLQHYILS